MGMTDLIILFGFGTALGALFRSQTTIVGARIAIQDCTWRAYL